MGIVETAKEARLGPVVRVHRRYPKWEDIQLSLYGLGALFFIAVVPVLALWLNHWRFLPGVLFVLGCIAGALVAAPWYHAATRGERYAVAELGVLVWSPRIGEASAVIPWAAVLRVTGRRVIWRDAEEERQLTVSPMVGRRDLLTAFDRRAPVPERAVSRIGPPAVAAVLVLLAAGSLVWFGAVPVAVELVRGERPKDVFALSRICDGGGPFRGSARYRGAAPHPVVVVNETGADHVAGAQSASGNRPAGRLMQLVACGRQVGRAKPDALASCPYQPVLTGSAHTVNLYQSRYEYDVRQARTGRHVGTVTVDGDTDPTCNDSWTFTENDPHTVEVDLDPTPAQLDTAFAALVNGPAPS